MLINVLQLLCITAMFCLGSNALYFAAHGDPASFVEQVVIAALMGFVILTVAEPTDPYSWWRTNQ